jgi:hypothetical protein
VLELLQEFLGPHQVFDLSRVNPTEVLKKFISITPAPIPSLRVLVAGGDGSAGEYPTGLIDSMTPYNL